MANCPKCGTEVHPTQTGGYLCPGCKAKFSAKKATPPSPPQKPREFDPPDDWLASDAKPTAPSPPESVNLDQPKTAEVRPDEQIPRGWDRNVAEATRRVVPDGPMKVEVVQTGRFDLGKSIRIVFGAIVFVIAGLSGLATFTEATTAFHEIQGQLWSKRRRRSAALIGWLVAG